jgi:hypothetical protein
MKIPEVGDVYIKHGNGSIVYAKITEIHVSTWTYIRYRYLDLLDWWNEDILKNFESKFSYIPPEEYNDKIKRLLNEELIKDIVE